MEQLQKNVLKFHQDFGIVINSKPCIPDDFIVQLRIRLIEEEFKELIDAIISNNEDEIARELADLIYVCHGTAVSYGIDMEPVHEEVHRSNMTKIWPDKQIH